MRLSARMPEASVKILVYGAGVIGTLYAARLQEGGHRVIVRLADIRRYGLALEDIVGQGRSTTQVDTTERLGPNDQHDIVLIAVRRDQVARIVPELTANHRIPTLIFMLNNPIGLKRPCSSPRPRSGSAWFSRGGRHARWPPCALRNDCATANYVRRTGRATNRAPARTGKNISAVRISYDDVSRHGRVAKGARFLRDGRQRRDLHGWRRTVTDCPKTKRPWR
jgi:hypothetical protein